MACGKTPISVSGIGINRLIIYLTNNPSIQKVLFFPQMCLEVHAVKIEFSENHADAFNVILFLQTHNSIINVCPELVILSSDPSSDLRFRFQCA